MSLITSYGIYIREKEYQKILKDTMEIYRKAVDFIISVRLDEDELFRDISWSKKEMTMMESLIHKTKDNPHPKYDFDEKFYKFPSEYRRDAIVKANALVKSYKSNLNQSVRQFRKVFF